MFEGCAAAESSVWIGSVGRAEDGRFGQGMLAGASPMGLIEDLSQFDEEEEVESLLDEDIVAAETCRACERINIAVT